MGIIGNLFKKEPAKNPNVRVLRDNPSSSYDLDTGIMTWGTSVINPGDYIRVKHSVSDGYSNISADEAGMFLGVQGDDLVFQTGVKKQRAVLLKISSIEVMSKIDENTEE